MYNLKVFLDSSNHERFPLEEEFFDYHGIIVSKLLSQQQKFTFNQ